MTCQCETGTRRDIPDTTYESGEDYSLLESITARLLAASILVGLGALLVSAVGA